jgi:hypothetical protein
VARRQEADIWLLATDHWQLFWGAIMKKVLAMTAVSLIVAAGCTRWNMLNPQPNPPPTAGNTPSVAALVKYLNDNSGRIQTMRCDELDMTCSVGVQSFGLRGQMIAQRPKNFLMGAKSLGKSMVDLGSNDKEFWYWISQDRPPYQFYCGYKELAEGRVKQMPFPFQPDWVIDAMGLGSYGPAERYQLVTEGNTLKLVEKARSPQGQPVRKVIVMNSRAVKAPQPQVQAFLLLDDATGKEICSAHITEIQVDRSTGGILPRRIEFRWTMPEQRLKLAMKLDGVVVNPQIPASSFQRRPMQGVPSYDLATGRLDQPASLQRVQGIR